MPTHQKAGICLVPDCLSAYYPGSRTRFHKFPVKLKERGKWLRSLGMKPSDYTKNGMICYLHFKSTDYKENNIRKKLKDDAVPSKLDCSDSSNSDIDLYSDAIKTALEKVQPGSSLSDTSDDDLNLSKIKKKIRKPKKKPKKVAHTIIKHTIVKNEKVTLQKKLQDSDVKTDEVLTQVCRICLATGCKMYSMKKYDLEQKYLLLTGITCDMFDDTKMPQVVCYECVKRLQNYVDFSTRSLTAWTVLMELIEQNTLTLDTIQQLDRQKSNLASKLALTVIEYEEIDDQKDSINDFNDTSKNDDDPKDVDFKFKPEFDINVSIDYNGEESDQWEEDNEVTTLTVANSDENSEEDVTEEYCTFGKKTITRAQYKKEFNKIFIEKTMNPQEQREEFENRKNNSVYLNSKFKCVQCYRGFQLEDKYDDHMKRHTNECGEFVCDICKTHYLSRIAIVKHIRASHDKIAKCRLCPFISSWKSAQATHKISHEGFRFRCSSCPKHYSKHSTYMYHVQSCHPEDAICHLCGESFTGIPPLQKHLQSKHLEGDLQIQPSTKSTQFGPVKKIKTTTKYTIVGYVTTLPQDSPVCDQCNVQFLNKRALERHLRVSPSHGNPPSDTYKPLKCGDVFPGFRMFQRHFADQHPGEPRGFYPERREFVCDQCGKMFWSLSVLNDHNQTHCGLEPYKCDKCGKTFSMKSTLHRHLSTHKPAPECNLCGKQFAAVYNLKRHILIHMNAKPYACEPCNKRFCTPSEKKAHIAHCHLGVPYPKKRPKHERMLRPYRHRLIKMDIDDSNSTMTDPIEEELIQMHEE
ncbi:zinc finger protein 836-like isoform X2 [Ostrinia nubilalis]|uniref:zinc finger protein 836-like isoform X2 n=1 Tax=Ostrinia nubilalis TaxID=29057 RepID=UPI0030822643